MPGLPQQNCSELIHVIQCINSLFLCIDDLIIRIFLKFLKFDNKHQANKKRHHHFTKEDTVRKYAHGKMLIITSR